MTLRTRAIAGLLAAAIAVIPTAGSAQGFAGAYLAATSANINNDYEEAVTYYVRALARDPENRTLLRNALIAMVAAGHFNEAERVAAGLASIAPQSQIAALTELALSLRDGDFETAAEIADNDDFRFNPLMQGLVAAWAEVGRGNYDAAVSAFDALDQNDTLLSYARAHKALALALVGDYAAAADVFEAETGAIPHVNRSAVMTHIASLSQSDRIDRALEVAEQALSDGFSDPELEAARDRLAEGEAVPFDVIVAPAEGAATAFSLISSALFRDQSERLSLIYARLSTLIWPDYEEGRVLVAEVLQSQGQYDLAIEEFAKIAPTSAWYISAEIGRAEALQRMGAPERAIEVLASLSREMPDELTVLTALGDAYRSQEEFLDAEEAYTRAFDLIEVERPSHWLLYFHRGIVRERSDQWDLAEADFRRALELEPSQPHVLNYLGYSLVELRRNLDEALSMIEEAVAQRPEDGYITDSLGWVLYRLGRFEEAVPHMERAVELTPVDPIINDHLGDVLWKVGRKLEAEFQWRRALSFEPEDEDAVRIRRKLEVGLDVVLEEEDEASAIVSPTASDAQ
ncbi:MAG: tetratricopeptide repeat protein [Pseudomonadota bacterium]